MAKAKKPGKPDTPKKKGTNWGAVAKGGGVLAALSVITGLAFLPSELMNGAMDSLFFWLPEDQRPAGCVCSSCSSSCSLLVGSGLLVLAMFMMQSGGKGGGSAN